MKTLDEILEAIKTKSILKLSSRKKDDRWVVPIDLYQEIIYYLREYQRDKQIYSYDIARRNLEVAERNDPLSWDELRRIDEEPIWIEVKNGEKKWVITCIDPDDVDRIYITDAYGLRGILNMKMYFKGEIKAYRKERK